MSTMAGARLLHRLVERTLDGIVRIGGHRMIPPEPAHHVGKYRAALLLSVTADAPRVIEVVALVGESVHEFDVLHEPVARLVVLPVAADAAIVVAAVLKVDPDRFLLGLPHDVGVRVAAAQVREAADDAEDLVEVGRPLPRDGERGDRARAGAADA